MGTNYRHLLDHLIPAINTVESFGIEVSYATRSYTIISQNFCKIYFFPSLRTMHVFKGPYSLVFNW